MLSHPATVKEGPPLMRWESKPFETSPSWAVAGWESKPFETSPLLGGGWEGEQVVVAVG